MTIPADFGFPARFTEFRKGQFEAAVQIGSSQKRFILDCNPTGAGKSIINVLLHKLLDARTLYVTANKSLQRQLGEDFTSVGMVDIRGQGNYQCVALADRKGFHGCDKGPCHFGGECELHPRHPNFYPGCEFYDRLGQVRQSRLVVTNYNFLMSANRYMDPGVLGRFDLLVLDEAHEAPDKLSEFCSVELTDTECKDHLDSELPPVEDGTEAWVNWAIEKIKVARSKLEFTKLFHSDDTDLIFELSKMVNKLEFLATAHVWHRGESSDPEVSMPGQTNDWVGERTEKGRAVVFAPVWAHRYAEQWLFGGIPKVVLTSATILPQTAQYLGITDFDYIQHPSTFPLARRPIYLIPCASISSRSTDGDYRAQQVKIDQVIGGRLDRKGIIQPHSYDRAYRIRMNSEHKRRIIYNERGKLERAVDEYKMARPGTVFISPVIEQGFDFPYQECEYNIIAKVPFPDTRSAVMKARCRSDKKYQNYVTVIKLMQMVGRGMRVVDDFCETFIFDDNIFWFIKAARSLFPSYFSAAFKIQDTLPPVPPPLPPRPRRV